MLGTFLDIANSMHGQMEMLLAQKGQEKVDKWEQMGQMGAQILVPFLLKKLGLMDTTYTEQMQQTQLAQAQTQEQLQQSLQAELRGERTPAVAAIGQELQRAFRGQRQAAAASASRQGVAGTRVSEAQQQRLDEQFNAMLSNLLAQNYARAQGLAAGQAGVLAGSQQFLSQTEQDQMAEVSKGIGSILGNLMYKQDPDLARIEEILRGYMQNEVQSVRQTTKPGQPSSEASQWEERGDWRVWKGL